MRRALIGCVCLVILAACTGAGAGTSSVGASVAPSMAPAPSPSPTLPGMTLVKSISATCSFTLTSDTPVGKSEVLVEHFTCRYVMTDDRVSGTFQADITTTFEPADAPTARWEGTFSITNDGGSWTGTGRGSLVFWSDTHGPTNYGIDRYEGQGAYAGLKYVELIAGSDTNVDISGWISGGS